MDWIFVPMTAGAAKGIAQWRYEPPYDFYNWPSESDPAAMVIEDAFVCLDTLGEPAGTFSFGPDGQIPTVEKEPYEPGFLDIGLRLRPDLCGKGLGEAYVKAGLEFGKARFGSERFRLSVAAFNQRAVKVYKKCGFVFAREVTNSYYKNKFYIMVRRK